MLGVEFHSPQTSSVAPAAAAAVDAAADTPSACRLLSELCSDTQPASAGQPASRDVGTGAQTATVAPVAEGDGRGVPAETAAPQARTEGADLPLSGGPTATVTPSPAQRPEVSGTGAREILGAYFNRLFAKSNPQEPSTYATPAGEPRLLLDQSASREAQGGGDAGSGDPLRDLSKLWEAGEEAAIGGELVISTPRQSPRPSTGATPFAETPSGRSGLVLNPFRISPIHGISPIVPQPDHPILSTSAPTPYGCNWCRSPLQCRWIGFLFSPGQSHGGL